MYIEINKLIIGMSESSTIQIVFTGNRILHKILFNNGFKLSWEIYIKIN